MRQNYLIAFVVFLASLTPILCQTNGVRANLIQCYNTSFLPEVLSANSRPPATLNVFIELIRRLEDANPTVTARELSAALLQRLRQDGIMGTRRVTDSRFGIPFSPKRLEAYKSTMFLQRFLTNISLELNYGDLDPAEVCTLHFMISSTIDNRVRNDESTTCSRSSRYTSRIFRKREAGGETTTVPETTEVANGEPETPEVENVEVEGVEGFGVRSTTGGGNDISQCPLELGVVFTNYGTVKGGQVLAGIATGFNYETVLNCDNRYAGTISGEIAEAALVQASDSIEIGAQGGWNSSINPRHYFLQRNTILQTTDAEIRGSLDGLYMALRLDSWRSTFSDIKVSQILDMYYSPYQKGVFDPSFKSCNRNILYTEMTTTQRLQTEVFNVMGPLDDASQYGQTVSPSAYETLTNASVDSFNRYLPQMNTTDLACRPDDSNIERVATDLLIFVDASWNYNTIQSVLSYTLDGVDVNKFGTRYTIFNGRTGANLTTNGTRYLLDLYKQYNLTVHQSQARDFDYTRVCETVETLGRAKLGNTSYTGGESTIVLLVPRTTPTDTEKTFLSQRREIIRQYIPDLTILVLGAGSQGDYSSIVSTPNRDVIILSETTNEETLKQTSQSVVERIKNVPRAVVNPTCGAAFNGSVNSFSLTQYVEPRGVNYYRISANYFLRGEGTRNLKITENSYGSIDVCISRDQSRPSNLTSECETLRSSVRTVDISGYCGGSVSDCSPIYISVAGNTTQTRCKDVFCRFPDDIRYTISLENVGCASSAIRIVSNLFVVTVLFFLLGF